MAVEGPAPISNNSLAVGSPVRAVDVLKDGKRPEWRIGDIVTLKVLGTVRQVRFINKKGHMEDVATEEELKLPSGEPYPPPPFDPSAPTISTGRKQFIARVPALTTSPTALTFGPTSQAAVGDEADPVDLVETADTGECVISGHKSTVHPC